MKVRALVAADADAARALVEAQFGGTRYAARLLEQLADALAASDASVRAMVASTTEDATLLGAVVLGPVAGAVGTVRVHAMIGTHPSVMRCLARATVQWCTRRRVRLAVHETADDGCFAVSIAALRECGFAAEGELADWYAEGIGQVILVRRLQP